MKTKHNTAKAAKARKPTVSAVLAKARKLSEVTRNPYEQEVTVYVVAVEGGFFLSWRNTEWTDSLMWARRFNRANEAVRIAEETAETTSKSVKVMQCSIALVATDL